MANISKKLEWNAEGLLFVDSTCIDCETCRILSPEIYSEKEEMSFVKKQPSTKEELESSLKALLSCPTGSIGSTQNIPELKDVRDGFPYLLEENVYYNGFHSEKSFGAFSYFISHPEGNILIDSPRFTNSLVKKLESLGGVKYLFLTHQDDIADHELFSKHFGCKRIIHEKDQRRVKAEIVLEGEESFQFSNDFLCIPVPGHTKGSCVLLYRNHYLFTGDHLAYSEKKGHLHAFRDACWFDWKTQIQSMKKLKEYSFLYVLPGHGRSYRANNYEVMKNQMEICINWMENK